MSIRTKLSAIFPSQLAPSGASASAAAAPSVAQTAHDQLQQRRADRAARDRKDRARSLWDRLADLDAIVLRATPDSAPGHGGGNSLPAGMEGSRHLGYRTAAVYRAPRHPIVLCHGLFGFDVLGKNRIGFITVLN
ncbi:hypothetical protein BDK51DRAFT_44094 [Blyttiomyces helicus]|uniref:Alpha/Beta hydrolase protein n=1 Tax=Blyttiomyces helicus TaxID=388810 RepID=A0A4P9W2T6_9FUNG|nr:hypothetical protein BDK51DRAFT_44094 [Blyttiomyces helicus]|eukprot:RKO86579.1 hypothetical protein BDK51DRAFT_44094 [Blyttiomyces helicus]